MKARIALALAVCCAEAFAQLPASQAPPPILEENAKKKGEPEAYGAVQIDALVTDSGGHPVAGLTAADFEVTQDDKPQKLSAAAYVDGKGGRTFVFVIDDLELPLKELEIARLAVQDFIKTQLRPNDRAAILGTAKGISSQEELRSDPDYLLESLNAIEPLGPSAPRADPVGAARGALCQLFMVFDNLQQIPGRTSVVFFSNTLRSAGASFNSLLFSSLIDAAAQASIAFYYLDPDRSVQVAGSAQAPDPKAPVPLQFATRSLAELQNGLPHVAQKTGGLLFESGDPAKDLAKVAQEGDGYYRLVYPLTEANYQFSNRYENVRVRVNRPGLNVRPGAAVKTLDRSYDWPDEKLARAQAIPFSRTGIRVRMTPIFNHSDQGSSIDVLVHMDVNGIGMTEDLNKTRQSRIDIAAAILGPTAVVGDQVASSMTLRIQPQEYQAALRDGISFALKLPIHRTGPGGWPLWVMVLDETTGRMGSSSQFVEIPNLQDGKPALSGVTLRGADKESSGGSDVAAVRIFRPEETLRYEYSIYNLKTDKEKRAQIEVQVHLYRKGAEVFAGNAIPLAFPPGNTPLHRSAAGTLTLRNMPAGKYLFELRIKDMLAPTSATAIASQYTDFEVRL